MEGKNEEEDPNGMALRQLIIGKKIEGLQAQLEELREQNTALETRREEMKKREDELMAAVEEVTEETSAEDRAALEEETSKFETDDKALEGEETENRTKREDIERQINDLQAELEELNARSTAAAVKKPEERKEEKEMETREFFGMSMQQRDAFMARQDVKDFLQRVRDLGKQQRAVSGAELLIPDVVLGIMREQVAATSKLYKHVNVRRVSGTSRMTIAGTIPEGVWTEMCARLNELNIGFNNVEVDGYKVGGYMAVCNALLEDSDISLAQEIITALSRAIGFALDKAIIYGTGTKMPLGIVPRLAQTENTSENENERPWVDLSATNLTSITGKNGIELYKAIVIAAAAAKNKYSTGAKFWAMNESTYNTLLVEAMTINATGAIVSGQNMTMPIVGGAIELLEFMPDGAIVGGYGDLYLLVERAGTAVARSEHVRFIEDQTVFKATARYDGVPVIAEGFVGIGIGGAAPAAADVTFAEDRANP